MLAEQFLSQKLWQVVALLRHVEAEFEVLRIDTSDVQVGDIAHRAHGKGRIKMRDLGCIAGRVLEPNQALGPARCIVVVRGKPLLPAGFERSNDGQRLGRRLSVADPDGRIVRRLIQRLNLLPVVRKIRRCQIG